MANLDIIVLSIAIVHAMIRIIIAKRKQGYRSSVWIFISTLVIDFLIYMAFMFLYGFVKGVSIPMSIFGN